MLAMPVEDPDLEAAAAAYAELLPGRFDLVHLGLGPDGHTASLVPGDPVLEVSDRLVAVTQPYQEHRRMTLTYPALARADEILWLISGEDKRDALARLLAGDTSIPAGRVQARHSTILADSSADLRQTSVSPWPAKTPTLADSTSSCSRRAAVDPLHRLAAPTKMVATMAGGNNPCSTTPGIASRRAARAAGSPTSPVKSAITPPSGLGGCVSQPDGPDSCQRRLEAEGDQLQRDRWAQSRYRLAWSRRSPRSGRR